MKTLLESLPHNLQRELARGGFDSLMDLLLHFPLRHEDWQTAQGVAALRAGEVALVEGEVAEAYTVPARGRQHFLVKLRDANGDVVTLRFFNVTPGLKHFLEVGRQLRARGKAKFSGRGGWEMAHPKFSTASTGTVKTIYPAAKALSSAEIQRLIGKVLAQLQLPALIPAQLATFDGGEISLNEALQAVHQPGQDGQSPLATDHPAWRRLKFEELTAHQAVLRRRYYRRKANAPAIAPPAHWRAELNRALPFTLTQAQERAVDEIGADMQRAIPMRRLLQGDVGSGKTAVAAAACYLAITAGHTAAFMAPTEILAEQHFQSLSKLFAHFNIQCELYTGSISAKQKELAEGRLRFGLSSLVVGTHALFQESAHLPRLALAVIDEQHRFGVEQRRQFAGKGAGVHELMMSATPIPRTLALSLYADMDVSVLDEKPAGRLPVRTIVSAKRGETMASVAQHIGHGGRVYWVCPRVEESEKSDLSDVHSLAAEIRAAHREIDVGILHGRMKAAEKTAVMEKFRSGAHHLLAATTVIEVGVDVAQADVMVIEHADRLGLAQLHQLRGRVGRGDRAGVCILLYEKPLSEEGRQRLQTMRETDDGFKVARKDLAMRGAGEFLGNRQSGLPSLRVARIDEAQEIAEAAQAAAEWMLQNDKRGCLRHMQMWMGVTRVARPPLCPLFPPFAAANRRKLRYNGGSRANSNAESIWIFHQKDLSSGLQMPPQNCSGR